MLRIFISHCHLTHHELCSALLALFTRGCHKCWTRSLSGLGLISRQPLHALPSTIAPALFSTTCSGRCLPRTSLCSYLRPSMGSYLLHPCSRTAPVGERSIFPILFVTRYGYSPQTIEKLSSFSHLARYDRLSPTDS